MLVVVIADRFGVGNGFIAMDLDVSAAGAVDVESTLNIEMSCSRRAPWQAGQEGVLPLRTSASNCSPQSRHLKSYKGTSGILSSQILL